MRKLKIAQVAPLWFPIPPKKYGGTERIVYHLTEGLVKKGHEVTLFASGDSKTKAKLFSVTKRGLISRRIPWQDWWWNNLNYSIAFSKAKNFDIIHSHWTPLGVFFQNFVKTPVLHTFHNIPKRKSHLWQVLKHFKNSNVVFVSKKERKNSKIRFKREFVVYNGIDVSKFKFNPKPKEFFLWVGRICPQKGTKEAILIAKKAKVKLFLVGQLQPMYLDYFEKEIRPNLGKDIKYLGELNENKLISFYRNAKAFLYPLQWEEPFGLCLVEAMACGTPVIAFKRGSIPEVVKNGKTGFIVKNEKEAIEAIKEIEKIKREDCREWVEKNFNVKKMVEDYEKIYYKLIK
jgi:glycosyltransferase involved in cell wall biosynthesis